VLGPATTGIITRPRPAPSTAIDTLVTPVATFRTNFRGVVDALRSGAPVRGGLVAGVVDVTNIPHFFPAIALNNPTFRAGFETAVGQPVTVLASCNTVPPTVSLIAVTIISAIRSGVHPPTIGCDKSDGTVGDTLVLDAQDITILRARVTAFNGAISAKADTVGFAYLDPNTELQRLHTTGEIPTLFNLADPIHPFGDYISLDGIHPTGKAHRRIADLMIRAINSKYGTGIPGLGTTP
jgi:lysophospholipase L1-like esterase